MPGIHKDLLLTFGKISGKAYIIDQIFGCSQIFPVFYRLEFNKFHIWIIPVKSHPWFIIRKIVNDPDMEILLKFCLGQQILENGMRAAGHASAPKCLI